MPVEVKGLANLKRNLNKYTPDLYKEMNKEIKAVMIPVRNKARGFVPSTALSGWVHGTGRWETKKYDPTIIKKSIYYSQGKTKSMRNGWRSAYYVANGSAAGAIYEVAKVAHSPQGQHFIDSMGDRTGAGKKNGRLIYRAWAQDNSHVIPAVIKAINTTTIRFNNASKGI